MRAILVVRVCGTGKLSRGREGEWVKTRINELERACSCLLVSAREHYIVIWVVVRQGSLDRDSLDLIDQSNSGRLDAELPFVWFVVYDWFIADWVALVESVELEFTTEIGWDICLCELD